MTLAEQKNLDKLALESLVAQCQREVVNLERFEDERCLVATADLASKFADAINAADALQDAWDAREFTKCDECGEPIPDLAPSMVNEYHRASCSLSADEVL